MTTEGLLQDRTTVITGAGSGVGRAAAVVFAREGARVVVSDVRDEWGSEGGIQLTRALAVEVAPHGIRVNCVCPGAIDTNFSRPEADAFRERSEDEKRMIGANHPLGRVITAEDVAEAALFLASDRAWNVTGVAFPVDGGRLAV